jgi:hypothetical protein
MGALHLQQYLAEYSVLPTIGTLFLLNFIGGLAVGGALLIQPPRSLRLAATLRAALALAGVAMAVTAIAFLLISEQTPLFGFLEYGYRTPVVLALVFEGLAALMLTGYLLGLRRARHSRT